jgi:YggT family protein
MTATPPPDPHEPPAPQRGLTREERGRDVSEAQAEAEAEASVPKKALKFMSPRFVLSQADGYPVVIKQFLQFCLILVYPAFVFAALFGLAVYYLVLLPGYYILLAVFWVLFWPLRMRQKKKNPEEYEAYKKNYWKKMK